MGEAAEAAAATAAAATAASTSTSDDPHPYFMPTGTVEVPVFYPTIDEMRDFPALINKIEQQHGAHLVCGIAKDFSGLA
ncbi:unnamed protein product [Gongylonema pulchrum]|uniref:JmjN domain-containing protein n=1 Tax=Gongylonema pulchrum TaxID=637853 RepID=A0A183ECF2_9BILA|nr:unnamed protein product [Gongylonema pulchrum]